jgi:4-hydroxybutyrate CoA-transferase
VDTFVTEFGVAHLKGKTARQRKKALIDIAHPMFRDDLASHGVST